MTQVRPGITPDPRRWPRAGRTATGRRPTVMRLLTRRAVLIEEEGCTCLADSDSDSDETRALRPAAIDWCAWRAAHKASASPAGSVVAGRSRLWLASRVAGHIGYAAPARGGAWLGWPRRAAAQPPRGSALAVTRVVRGCAGAGPLRPATGWKSSCESAIRTGAWPAAATAAGATRAGCCMAPTTTAVSGLPFAADIACLPGTPAGADQ